MWTFRRERSGKKHWTTCTLFTCKVVENWWHSMGVWSAVWKYRRTILKIRSCSSHSAVTLFCTILNRTTTQQTGFRSWQQTHVAQQENPLLFCNELIETMGGRVSILSDIKYSKDFTKTKSLIDIVSILRCLKVSDTSLCNKRQLN